MEYVSRVTRPKEQLYNNLKQILVYNKHSLSNEDNIEGNLNEQTLINTT